MKFVGGVLCAFFTCALVGLTSQFACAQTAPSGSLSPGFQACEQPLNLIDYYGLRHTSWTIEMMSVQPPFVLGIVRNGQTEQRAIWVHNMGPDGTLDSSDLNFNQLFFIGDLPSSPVHLTVSKSGLIAFVIADPSTRGREYPDPNWTAPTQTQPTQPMISVHEDEILVTCYYANCGATIQEVKRFRPKYHVAYSTPTQPAFMPDGVITSLLWEESPNGLSELVYAYAQYDNNIIQSPPWELNPPSNPPPFPVPHIAIERFFPLYNSGLNIAYQPTNGGTDGTFFSLSKSISSPFGGIPVGSSFLVERSVGSLSLTGGLGLQEYSDYSPQFVPGVGVSYTMTVLSDWTDGPQSPFWMGAVNSGSRLFTLGHSRVAGYPEERIAIRAKLESSYPSLSQIERDLVFRSSANGYVASDMPIGPQNDDRNLISMFLMDHPYSLNSSLAGSLTVALETQPGIMSREKRTQLYRYQPSLVTGQPGNFVPYKEVLTQSAAYQAFWLWGAGGDYVYGLLDRYQPTPAQRDWALVKCP
jgi:hypothetical protein